ncbi:MAG: oligosaccharide flippase family protein [Saprospiraceae bacterium]|nr:oligosaccharide flippase family protein [Saprospiraceae bacterium]
MSRTVLRNTFVTNLGLVVLLNLLIKPLYIFGIDRGVQNVVGPEEYGLYYALFNFAYLFQLIHDLGIQNFNHVHFSKSPHLLAKYLPRILGSKMAMAVLYFMVIGLAFWILGYEKALLPLFALIGVNHVLVSLVLLLRTSISAMGHYRTDSLLSVLDKALLILVVGGLLLNRPGDITVLSFAQAQTCTLFLTLVVSAFLLLRSTSSRKLSIQFSSVFFMWLVRQALPFALVLALMTLYTRLDAVMLERILADEDGQYQAGLYAAGYRILDAVNMVGVLMAGLLLPMMSKSLSTPSQLAALTADAFGILWTITLTVAAGCIAFSDQIIYLLYADATEEWSAVFAVLMLSYLASALSYVYGTLLTAGEHLRPMNLIFALGFGCNFILNYFLIPVYAAWGSALATVVTQFLVSVSLLILCQQTFKLPFRPQKVLTPLLLGLVVSGLAYALTGSSIPWYYSLVILTVGGFIASAAMGLLPLHVLRTRSSL